MSSPALSIYPLAAGIRRIPGLPTPPSSPTARPLERLCRGAEIPTHLARRRGGGTIARAGLSKNRANHAQKSLIGDSDYTALT